MNLSASWHSSGTIVLKLKRQRPAFSVNDDLLFYVKDRFLRLYEFSSQKDTQVIHVNQTPKTLSYSPTENALLICYDLEDGCSYELYIIPKDIFGTGDSVEARKRGIGGSAVFIGRNQFAVLEKSSNQVVVMNRRNEVVKRSGLPIPTDAIFYGGKGKLLCRAEDKVVLFDLHQRLVLGDLQTRSVRYVVWSNDMESVALLSKHTAIIASKNLVHQCTLREIFRVKSGSWDENGVFIYSTLNHIKYCLLNGDSGIIKALDVPIYITKVVGNKLFWLDRDGKNKVITIDTTEYVFKLSLLKNKFDHVMSMIRNDQICGQAMIAYLQQKGFPEVALHFVRDERTRFSLALESGNIQTAVASAKEIDEKEHWYRLGVEALRQGNTGIAEYAYQRTKCFERLSFLYLITGNLEKLSKMLRIAEFKNDTMGRFHNAMYLGDVRERVTILENVPHLNLAYITASVHGLKDDAARIAIQLGDILPCLSEGKVPSLLKPPAPIVCGGDWPLVKRIFEDGQDNIGKGSEDEDERAEDNEDEGWELEDLELPPEA